MMRSFIVLAALLLAGAAHADSQTINVPAGATKVGITIEVPDNAEILFLKASSSATQVAVYVKEGAAFTPGPNYAVRPQADYLLQTSSDGAEQLAIGTYAKPALHAGTWQVALVNLNTVNATTVTLETSISETAKIGTDFVVSFDKASGALEQLWGGADGLNCDIAPWTDAEHGEYRRNLVLSTLEELSTQIHSPVPVHVQACWREYGQSSGAGGYTLASATATKYYRSKTGMPLHDTWYTIAAAERLAGHRLCTPYTGLDCSIPDIIVWFNSDDVASGAYDGSSPPDLMRSTTMHEVVHGLGFLSLVDLQTTTNTGNDNPRFMMFRKGSNDAYTTSVARLVDADGSGNYTVVPFADLSNEERFAAVTSKNMLVWNDPQLAEMDMNNLSGYEAPLNLVELYAPSSISLGSTLSHLASVQSPQLMTPFISYTYPQKLGLAGPMLAKVGWSTGDDYDEQTSPPTGIVTGNWYDTAHSGHGINLGLVEESADGDVYSVIFYTFDADGNPEYYLNAGVMHDGILSTNLGYPIYDPETHSATYPDGAVGHIEIDFTDAAASSEACADHSSEIMASMDWSIGDESGSWCISPAVGNAARPAAEEDLNGVWSADTGDSGWGLTVIETEEDGAKYINTQLYYFGTDNKPRWAAPGPVSYDPGSSVPIYQFQGYCRTCEPVALAHEEIGTITIGLNYPEHVELPSGDNTISIDINNDPGPIFQRTDTAMRMYSIPAGQ